LADISALPFFERLVFSCRKFKTYEIPFHACDCGGSWAPGIQCWSAGLDDKENEVEATSELGDSLFLGKPQWELL
jgi:hypothetical protein